MWQSSRSFDLKQESSGYISYTSYEIKKASSAFAHRKSVREVHSDCVSSLGEPAPVQLQRPVELDLICTVQSISNDLNAVPN